jgi:hypothetical protein
VLSDGLLVNGSELVRGLNASVPATVVVTGGLAGDGAKFHRTWVSGADGPQGGLVRAVGLYGERVVVGHGSHGGWDAFGPSRLITRSDSNVLYELDGKPALELYRRYLGDRAEGLPATGLLFPLALRETPTAAKVLVRTLLAIDDARQSMTFAGNLPQGQYVQFMRANIEKLVDGSLHAAQSTCHSASHRSDILSIAISCVGRRLVLGQRAEEELDATITHLPEGTRQVGFYSYGEISPFTDGRCDLHNQTMTLTTVSER